MFVKFVLLVITVIVQQIHVNGDCGVENNLSKLNCECKNFNKEITCYGSDITYYPNSPEWDKLKSDNLIELSFGKNFAHLPFHMISSLTNLELFKLWRLKVTTIPALTFKNMNKLREVWIYNNNVHTLEENAFMNLPALKEVSLYWNEISDLDAKTFNGVPNLEVLNLSWNKISKIPRGFFDSMVNLRKLYMEYNPLTKLDLPLVAPMFPNFMEKDSVMKIFAHHYTCDCNLYWIVHINNNTKNEETKQHINEFTCKIAGDTSLKIIDYFANTNCPALILPTKKPSLLHSTDIRISGANIDEKKLNKLAFLFNVHSIHISNSTIFNPF